MLGDMSLGSNALDPTKQPQPEFFPAALIAQFPALANMSWDTMAPGSGSNMDDDDGAFSTRSSFDAGSGNEWNDEDELNSGYVSGPGTAYSNNHGGAPGWNGNDGQRAGGWASDYEA
jgi:hypothetical protein